MKDYREKELRYLLLIIGLLFFLWCTPLNEKLYSQSEDSLFKLSFPLIESVIISGVVPLVAFLGDCIVSSEVKNLLIGLFVIPQAGETVFTRINEGKVKDNRFALDKAREKYASIIEMLPADKKRRYIYENSHWYGLYHSVQEAGQVKQSQRDYLLCRDLNIESFICLLLYLAIQLFSSQIIFSGKFCAVLLAIIAITNWAAHIKMARFVNTVLAVDLAKNK